MSKQTAVNFLVEEFFNASRISEWHSGEQEEVITLRQFEEIVEKAKKMEKQQIMDAYNSERDLLSRIEDGSAAEEYYQEHYITLTDANSNIPND
jgi:hypothetical protein